MAKEKDIDAVRDQARKDAAHQKWMKRNDDICHIIRAVADPDYNPPSNPDLRKEYDRIYKDEMER